MAKGSLHGILGHLRGLVVAQDAADLADSALLERFLAQRDEAAFEALVRRHGPMVLAVCRRTLSNAQDVEDAFQATFLVLVRKAAQIARRELLGNWLYGVAYHTARAARAAAGRRRKKEAQVMPRPHAPEDPACQELLPLLDEELSRLPEKYRVPLVVCELQGRSRQEAARQLGLPEGTLSSRLARGRTMLAKRLTRRGVTLSSAAVATVLSQQLPAAALPSGLVQTTVKAGVLLLAGQGAVGIISTQVAALSEGVVKAMLLTKLKTMATVLLVSSVVVGMGTTVTHPLWATGSGDGAGAKARVAGAADNDSANRTSAPTASAEVAPKALLQLAFATAGTIPEPMARFHVLLRIADVQRQIGDLSGARQTRQEAMKLANSLEVGQDKVTALNAVAFAHAEAGDHRAVLETLQQAEQVANRISEAQEKANAMVRLVLAQARLGDYEGALRTAGIVPDLQATAVQMFAPYVTKKSGQAGRKALQQALELAQSAKSPVDKRSALASLAAAEARMGDLEAALRIADKLGDWRFVALQAIATAQAEAGDTVGALQTAKAIQPDEARAEVLHAVALAQAKAGDAEAARKTLQEVRQVLEKLPGPGRRQGGRAAVQSALAAPLGGIAEVQARLGDFAGALQTASMIDQEYYYAKTLLEIGTAQEAAGKHADAQETLLRAAHAAARITSGPFGGRPGGGRGGRRQFEAALLAQIAGQQAKGGNPNGAFQTVADIPIVEIRNTALAGIAQALARAGKVNEGLETLARIPNDDDKAVPLEAIVQAPVKAGEEQAARALAAQQTSPVLKAHAWLAIAAAKATPVPAKR